MSLDPVDAVRRSPVYRLLQERGADFTVVNEGAIAESLTSVETEEEQARQLSLCDLSVLPRCGFKGSGTMEWLTKQGLSTPPQPNLAIPVQDDGLLVRLAANECLLLADLQSRSTLCSDLTAKWWSASVPPETQRCFPLERQDSHAWFALTGELAPALFARMCAVDLRPTHFENAQVAQTMSARVSTIIIRSDLGDTLNYYVLTDTSSAEYLWGCIDEASSQLGGMVIGVAALRRLRN